MRWWMKFSCSIPAKWQTNRREAMERKSKNPELGKRLNALHRHSTKNIYKHLYLARRGKKKSPTQEKTKRENAWNNIKSIEYQIILKPSKCANDWIGMEFMNGRETTRTTSAFSWSWIVDRHTKSVCGWPLVNCAPRMWLRKYANCEHCATCIQRLSLSFDFSFFLSVALSLD